MFALPMNSATKRVAGLAYISLGVPVCTIAPSRIRMIRSLISMASVWSWVT